MLGHLTKFLRKLVEEKNALREEVCSSLSPSERKQAERDYHARREPRACGLTIHTGISCSYGCTYCYITDMGFTGPPRPYPLSGRQLACALLKNPYFVPGPWGTQLAFGSVTEPFMTTTKSRSFEYMEILSELLGNPLQVSTKSYLSREDAEKISAINDKGINFLVTIITLRHYKILEPGAPPPEKRLETISNLSEAGIHVTLFLRPIIPGLTEHEIPDIIVSAKERGAKSVVAGSLRVTPRILNVFRKLGLPTNDIVKRLPRLPRNQRDQVALSESDLKKLVYAKALEYGLVPLPSACAANIVSHQQACWACKWGPCGELSKLPVVSKRDVEDILSFFNIGYEGVEIIGNTIRIGVRERGEKLKIVYHWLRTLSRREIRVFRV